MARKPPKTPNMNTHLLVRNLCGTTHRVRTEHGCWIDCYDAETRTRGIRCARLGCGKQATVGGHVQLLDMRSNGKDHIVPLCDACNRLDEAYYLKQHVAAVEVRPN